MNEHVHIEPTIGRVVMVNYKGLVTAGIITGVLPGQMPDAVPYRILVSVQSPVKGGTPMTEEMYLLEDCDPRPEGDAIYAFWMPYQKQQAARQQKVGVNPPSHVERMQVELAELVERLKRLDAFVTLTDSEAQKVFDSLSLSEQRLLIEQRDAMQTYAEKLAARISLA